ncbi:MAG TPA: pirin family protein [Candidatus Eremiobacteraceae bacterium]
MKTQTTTFSIQRSGERYHADHGWLKSFHSLSFADYFDPANTNWGALRVFNDDYIAAGQGFPLHPHRDMEIITYVLSGQLEHRDSMGNRGVVGPGGVQFMSAGTGVRHSEVNHSPAAELHLVQMWIVPGRTGVPPTYGQHDFVIADRLDKWLDVAGGVSQPSAVVRLTQDASMHVARLEKAELTHRFAPGRLGFLFVADGTVEARQEQLVKGDAVRIRGIDELSIRGQGEILLWDLPDVG